MGNPVWLAELGRIDGALQFDGVDDFIVADAPVGLADGRFSVCIWVKGGTPGQAIFSTQGGSRWLYTNPADGSLVTDLSASVQPLFSDVVVTDGHWHRLVLVWDGVDRILHVDGQEVARDAQAEPGIPATDLLIGCGKDMTPGSFWSGLIDDVRIYDRVVRP